jgi:hypothetical protein
MLKIGIPNLAGPVAIDQKLVAAVEAQEAARVAFNAAALEAELNEGAESQKRLAAAQKALDAATARVAALEAAKREADTRAVAAEREQAAADIVRRWKETETHMKARVAAAVDAERHIAGLAGAWARLVTESIDIASCTPGNVDAYAGLLVRTRLDVALRGALLKAGFRWALVQWPWPADQLATLSAQIDTANWEILSRRKDLKCDAQ